MKLNNAIFFMEIGSATVVLSLVLAFKICIKP
jgi:hypothetical protein